MKIINKLEIKWFAYGLELFLVFIIESTPNLIAPLFGAYPMLLVCACLSIALFEGETIGMFYAIAGGLLIDYSSTKVFGFNALFLVILCYICGSLVVHMMRNSITTMMLLGSGSIAVLGLVRWLFLYVIWDYDNLFYILYSFILPSIAYSIIVLPVFYYLNRVITVRLSKH